MRYFVNPGFSYSKAGNGDNASEGALFWPFQCFLLENLNTVRVAYDVSRVRSTRSLRHDALILGTMRNYCILHFLVHLVCQDRVYTEHLVHMRREKRI